MSETSETADRSIGRAVQRLRARAGLSQVELSGRMRERGWKWLQPTAWSVEQGKRPVRLAEAVDLAAVLEANLEDLLADPLEGALRDLAAREHRTWAERAEAGALAHALQAQGSALADVQRASRGEPADFGADPAVRCRLAFEGFSDEELVSLLGHLGAPEDSVQDVLHVRDEERHRRSAGEVFGGALWAVLCDLFPLLRSS